MQTLSADAVFILSRMEVDRPYDSAALRALVPHASAETVGGIMHDLWVARQVERVGASAWRRHHSATPHAARPRSRAIEIVKPQDLFDHSPFADFFK